MRDGSRAKGLAQVADIAAQSGPETQQDRQGSGNGSGEDDGDDLRGRLGVVAEDVVDLGGRSVAQRGFGDGERDVGVAGDGEVEDFLLVGCGRAERSNDDGGGDWLGCSEELVGEVLLCLREVLVVLGAIGCCAYQRDLALAAVLDGEDKGLLQPARRVGQGEKGLVRALGRLSINSGEVELERVGGAKRYCLCEGGCSTEPGKLSASSIEVIICEELTCPWKLRLRQRLCWQLKRWHLRSSKPQRMQLKRRKAAAKTRNRERAS